MPSIDLHCHSTASDGVLTPPELVALAAERGLAALAITDHDTTAGLSVAQAAATEHDVLVVPGVEINTDVAGGQADILGYLFDPTAPQLADLLSRIRQARTERAAAIVRRLQALGAPISYDDVERAAAGGAVGRPHIARMLVTAGFVPDVSSAFELLIGRGRPAYVDRYRLAPDEACRAIRAAGGVASLAHPVPAVAPRSDPLRLRAFLPRLIEAGLGGLECYYPGYGARVARWLEALAGHFGLVPTGGSDFHGPGQGGGDLGSVAVPYDTVDRLRVAAGDRSG